MGVIIIATGSAKLSNLVGSSFTMTTLTTLTQNSSGTPHHRKGTLQGEGKGEGVANIFLYSSALCYHILINSPLPSIVMQANQGVFFKQLCLGRDDLLSSERYTLSLILCIYNCYTGFKNRLGPLTAQKRKFVSLART